MKNTFHLYKIAFLSLLFFSCTKEIEVSVINPDIDIIGELSEEGIISEFALINDIGLELIPVNQSIDQEEKTISLEYPFGTDVSSLFTKTKISDDATITPKEGEKVDFTQPVNFIVTAANGTENTYTVTATSPVLSEKQALLNMASALPNNTLNWSTETDITTWNDVTVENGRVIGLTINSINVAITSDIKNLIHLKSINISTMPGQGTKILLPNEFNSLKQLESFTASFVLNNFPEVLLLNTNLKSISINNLNSNTLNFIIPEDIGKLKKLENLSLTSSAIDKIPESVTELVMLKTLNLSGHNIFGSNNIKELPIGFEKLVNLQVLDLSFNPMLINIPESISKLTNLKELKLANIGRLKTIPQSVCDLEKTGTVITRGADVICQ